MTLTDEEKKGIATELNRARDALSAGNEGKARVCARRASGIALQAHYREREGGQWSGDAQTLLLKAGADHDLSAEVREAAVRLTTSVIHQATQPFTTDPIADARLIVSKIQNPGS